MCADSYCDDGWHRGERDPSKCYRASIFLANNASETRDICRYMRVGGEPSIPAEPRTADQAEDVVDFIKARKIQQNYLAFLG